MVFAAGFAMLAFGAGLLALLGPQAGMIGLILAATIVLYDWHHKGNPLGPLLMGLCRALVYLGAAGALGAAFNAPVLIGAAVMLIYVAGLTLASKRGYPGIGVLIAAIALVDAVAVASVGALAAALVCCALFVLTLILQRFVPGT
jgi:hypothetical protein